MILKQTHKEEYNGSGEECNGVKRRNEKSVGSIFFYQTGYKYIFLS